MPTRKQKRGHKVPKNMLLPVVVLGSGENWRRKSCKQQDDKIKMERWTRWAESMASKSDEEESMEDD